MNNLLKRCDKCRYCRALKKLIYHKETQKAQYIPVFACLKNIAIEGDDSIVEVRAFDNCEHFIMK